VTALGLTAAALLLLGSALLSASEAAVFSLTASSLRTLEDEGFRYAPRLAALRRDPGPLRATLLLLTTLLNVGTAGIVVADATLSTGVVGAVIALPATALAVYLLGEMMPRAAAVRRPVRLALASAPLLTALIRVFRPLVGPIARLEGLLSQLEREDGLTRKEREAMELTALGQEEGVVGVDEHLLVERAFRLDELTVRDVMTPRVDIFAWKDALTLGEVVERLDKVPYSRIPVYGDSVDEITGIVYAREIYHLCVEGQRDLPLREIGQEPYFVPASLSLTQLLRNFQARRLHLGIVADEFGGTDGLVTLEDVLEELVGEIVDETDVDEEPLIRVSRSEIVVDAAIDLRAINHAFNVSLPQLEYRSLNGLILEELGHVPAPGETIQQNGLRIEILEASETQVLRARLTKMPVSGKPEGD
jgi:CBS domain containing-hemolysin-like protein